MNARYDAYLVANRQRHLDELMTFMRFKTVSPGQDPAVREEAAAWLLTKIQELKPDVATLIKDAGHAPLVWAEWCKAGPDKPTVLVYCHYDVMPEGTGWTKVDPFDPKILKVGTEEVLYGRGSCDDKGQLWMQLKALETLLSTDGRLPVNVKCIFEGEEEVGSAFITKFFEQQKGKITCDALVISDTDFFADGVPSITAGLRGLTRVTGTVKGAQTDLHSGLYGGAVQNPLHALGAVIASLRAPDGTILVDGFYDEVSDVPFEQRGSWAKLPFSDEQYAKDLGVPALAGEHGYSTLERLWARPTLEVNAFTGGQAAGTGVTTSIPSEATFKITCRLVPDQKPEVIRQRVIDHLRKVLPVGVTLVFNEDEPGAGAAVLDIEQPAAKAAAAALLEVWGEACCFTRSGGSIPVVLTMQQTLGVDPVLLGFGLPDDNIHAPDEHFKLKQFDLGIRTLCEFWNRMAVK